MIEKTWKAAIYLRLSKEDGTIGESSSIKNQREIIKDFLAKNCDISIVSERIDDGISGVSFDRPSFNAMIGDVRDRVIDCVIVKDECAIIGLNREKPVFTGFFRPYRQKLSF